MIQAARRAASLVAVKPFLLLGTRDPQAAFDEYESVRRHLQVDAADLEHRQLTDLPIAPVDLDDYSGVVLGGGPFNASDVVKSDVQIEVEDFLGRLVDEVRERQFPFIGLCYGIGVVTMRLGGIVNDIYKEPVHAIEVELTDEGAADPLLEGVPTRFKAFVGHKESCAQPPPDAVLLATGSACPVQMYRIDENLYVTQFHPELDADDLATRIRLYENAGYFRPDEMTQLITDAHTADLPGDQHKILSNFARRYAR